MLKVRSCHCRGLVLGSQCLQLMGQTLYFFWKDTVKDFPFLDLFFSSHFAKLVMALCLLESAQLDGKFLMRGVLEHT
jgi:hypothetical protein